MRRGIAAGLVAICGAHLASAAALVERACAGNNINRLFKSEKNLPDAVVFCSAYLNIPALTVSSSVTPAV